MEGQNGGLLVITGPMGSGKSALLAQWVRRQQEEFEGESSGPSGRDDEGRTPFIALHMFSRLYDDLTSALGAYQNLLAQLYTYFEVEDHALRFPPMHVSVW